MTGPAGSLLAAALKSGSAVTSSNSMDEPTSSVPILKSSFASCSRLWLPISEHLCGAGRPRSCMQSICARPRLI